MNRTTTSGTWDVRGELPTVVDTRCGAVEYAEHGRGQAVLCLHGAMGGYDQSLLLGQVLGPPGYRYIGVSRPGYLGTPLDSGREPEDQARLFAALLDALGIERALVMAVSGGGYSALHFALAHPARCAGLVLASTTGGPVTAKIPWTFRLAMRLMRLPLLATLASRRGAGDPVEAARRSITDPALLERTIANAEAWDLLQQLQASTSSRVARRLPGTGNDIRVTSVRRYPLESIAVPTLVIHGTRDPLVPIDQHGRVLAARIAGAEFVELPGGEHAAIFSHRDDVRPRVAAFMRRHLGDAA